MAKILPKKERTLDVYLNVGAKVRMAKHALVKAAVALGKVLKSDELAKVNRAMDIILKPTSLSEIKHVFSGIYGEYLLKQDREASTTEKFLNDKESDETFELSEDKLTMRVIEWLKAHYSENISISDAAHYVHLSAGYLNRYLKRHTKRNYSDLLKEIRISASKKLLKETTLSVKAVAERTGYTDASYFARIFQESTGMTPTEFRRSV